MNINNIISPHRQRGRRPDLNKWFEDMFGVVRK